MSGGAAYVTFDGHRTGDKKPYLYKTTNYGRTWISLALFFGDLTTDDAVKQRQMG